MSDSVIYDRLMNWGRYWRDHDGNFGRCRSIEHRYVIPPNEGGALLAEERQRTVMPSPDMHDAIVVNDAWKKCSSRTKKFLHWSFCRGPISDERICDRCDIAKEPDSVFQLARYKAMKEIQRKLDAPHENGILAPNSRSSVVSRRPVNSETERPCVVRSTAKEAPQTD